MRAMRVVFANHEPFDPRRARAKAMLRLVCAVATRTPVTLLTPDTRERLAEILRDELSLEWPTGLNAIRLPAVYKRLGLTLNSIFLRAMERELRQIGPDVLWLRSDKLAAHFARRGARGLVYEAHMIGALYQADHGAPARRVAKADRLERGIFSAAAGVAVLNQLMEADVRARFAFNGPVARIPGGVDTRLFQPLWSGGDGRTICYAGTMQFWKGLDTLIEAMALAPELRLKLIGNGTREQESALREAATRLGVQDRVEFAGRVPQRELPGLLAQCACAVHPLPPGLSASERMTSPLKIFEYMAVGVPVVASDVASIREVIRDGGNGRLFRAGDAADLARVLREVCADPGTARELSRRAVADVPAYTFEARADAMVRLFGQVTAQSP